MRSVCGLDVHKDSVYLCILSEDGELIEKVFGVLTFQLHQMRDLLLAHHVETVSMESTSVYWIPIWRILAPHFHLQLVNPYFIKHHGRETILASLTGIISQAEIDVLRQLREELDLAEEHKQECLERMLKICQERYPDELRRLQTIPGVKERTATSLIAEIGTDMSKFETANHLAAWSGLRPRNDESNRKFKSRRITHGNVYLRKNIIQCAWAASRTKDCFFSKFSYHQTQVRKKNKMKVIVAVARKLLVAAWHVIHDKTDYVDFQKQDRQSPASNG